MLVNKVEICGVNTAKLPVLSNAKMRELFRALMAGDVSAREKLIGGNLRLVLSVIQRFNNRGENVDDLFQVGCIGLMKAIDNFDLGQNVKFSTYAVPMIVGEIRRYLRDNNAIRVSRSLRDTAYKALQARDTLVTRYSREPSIGEIACELKLPGKMWYLPWMPSKNRCPCLNRCIMMAEILFSSWTRSKTKKNWTAIGWRNWRYGKLCTSSMSASAIF